MADGTASTRTVAIVNARGLHARAAAKFTALAETYACDITVTRGGDEVSALSIMGLLMLAAAKDAEITIAAAGPGAAEALDALCDLVESGFGEGEEGDA